MLNLNFNSIFFSALEQFDVVHLWGPLAGGLNNMIFACLCLFGSLILIFWENVVRHNAALYHFGYALFDYISGLIQSNLSRAASVYFYYVLTLFTVILTANVYGLVPYSFSVTSIMAITFLLSSTTFFGTLIIGMKQHSWSFLGFFIPAGVPAGLAALLFVIELISYFARLFSLAVRLFANMMAGHTLLKILAGFVFIFFESQLVFGLLPFVLNFVVLAVGFLEVMIAFLQAYVFVILTIIYINEAVNLH